METIFTIGVDLWRTLCEMAPYLLMGFLIAGCLSVLISPETIERHLGGHGVWPVIKASLVGVPLPLCSCGVIPVAASLRRHGSSRGATTAFLISTPQTGVDSIAVTYGMLGPVFAIFRPAAAFVSGLLGGWLVEALDVREEQKTDPAICTDECCQHGNKSNAVVRILSYAFITLPRDLARPLLLGLAVAGIISAMIPPDFFSGTMGTGIVQMLVMMAFGIPLYVCATASVPIAAAMMLKGISPGAALVFLMTGPATNAATIATIWKIMGKRTALIYLFAVAATALASGLMLDSLFSIGKFTPEHFAHTMLPHWFEAACAVALLCMLAASFIKPLHVSEPAHAAPEDVDSAELLISGMTCSHCEATVKRALSEFPGVVSADVSRASGKARITGRNLNIATLTRIVGELGYKAEERKK